MQRPTHLCSTSCTAATLAPFFLWDALLISEIVGKKPALFCVSGNGNIVSLNAKLDEISRTSSRILVTLPMTYQSGVTVQSPRLALNPKVQSPNSA